jgi:PTH1 family peptidyl-tRNA hydrolase
MNDSGRAAQALAKRYGIEDLTDLVVVHDEFDLPVGRVKIKVGGGTAGHNGLKSLHAHLHDNGYVRVRIGIGKPGSAERDVLAVAVETAADAVEMIATQGVTEAMNRFNAEA